MSINAPNYPHYFQKVNPLPKFDVKLYKYVAHENLSPYS